MARMVEKETKKAENMEDAVPEAENLLRPREVAEKNKDKEEQVQEEEKKANGGILNNLISNLMGVTRTEEDKSGEKITCTEDEDEKKSESSSGGILDKIISHLPEDAVPTSDEASILIHSAID